MSSEASRFKRRWTVDRVKGLKIHCKVPDDLRVEIQSQTAVIKIQRLELFPRKWPKGALRAVKQQEEILKNRLLELKAVQFSYIFKMEQVNLRREENGGGLLGWRDFSLN